MRKIYLFSVLISLLLISINSDFSMHQANAAQNYDITYISEVYEPVSGYTNINVDTIDVSKMDDKCLMALFMALIRGERFHDGLILHSLEEGNVQRWLAKLREIVSGG